MPPQSNDARSDADRRLRLKAQTAANTGSLAAQAQDLSNMYFDRHYPDAVALPQSLIVNPRLEDKGLPNNLPEPCVQKITDLRDGVDDLSRILSSLHDDLHGAVDASGQMRDGLHARVRKAKSYLQELLDPEYRRVTDHSRDANGQYHHATLRQAENEIPALEAETKQKQTKQARASAAKKPKARLLERTLIYIYQNKSKGFTVFDGKSNRTETSIPALWSALEAARLELKNTQSAEPSAAERRARVQAFIESEAARGKPRIGRDGSVAFPRATETLQQLINVGVSNVTDAGALICWLHKDEILQKLLADLPTGGGLSAKQKAKRIAELEAEILDIERRECELIEASNGTIPYRGDTDVRAFLGLA